VVNYVLIGVQRLRSLRPPPNPVDSSECDSPPLENREVKNEELRWGSEEEVLLLGCGMVSGHQLQLLLLLVTAGAAVVVDEAADVVTDAITLVKVGNALVR
jgi:hypothetical protein